MTSSILQNIFKFIYYFSLISLFIIFNFLLFKYLKNEEKYKIHKLDVFNLMVTYLIVFTFIIKSIYINNPLIIIDSMNLFCTYSLNIILNCLYLVTIGRIYTEYIKLMNYAITFVILTIILALAQIIIKNVQQLTYNSSGKNIKLMFYILQVFFGLITIISAIINDYFKNEDQNLILYVREEDIYMNHLCASMIRRVKELYKSYLIIITLLLYSVSFNMFLFIMFDSEYVIYYSFLEKNEDNKDYSINDFFILTMLYFTKDILPYLVLVTNTLIYRWK